ncbi:YkuJ family protein [Levilactobacillus bambusae]|uniref:DUF1797 domain-containing protein n=1 Tax=Levilactobacillus bambusae TaxID=2024736 RepID=A0A2V1N0L7_9LACO|nr:YkuJ family protein [Levilactobacillus bambusae]PWF99889.1 DUF1797 domain-containing protein [Levilactobacillus bambusae]
MEDSHLVGIIDRLKVMQQDTGDEPQPRRFEKDGVERARVVYHQDSNTYTLYEFNPDVSFEFDNIDLVAIELFDLLSDN